MTPSPYDKGTAICVNCGARSSRGFGRIMHRTWCIFYGKKDDDHS